MKGIVLFLSLLCFSISSIASTHHYHCACVALSGKKCVCTSDNINPNQITGSVNPVGISCCGTSTEMWTYCDGKGEKWQSADVSAKGSAYCDYWLNPSYNHTSRMEFCHNFTWYSHYLKVTEITCGP